MHSPHINHIRDLLKLAPPVISSRKKESFDQERVTAMRVSSMNHFDNTIKKDACTQTDIKISSFDKVINSIFTCFNPNNKKQNKTNNKSHKRRNSFSICDTSVHEGKITVSKTKSGSIVNIKRTPTWNELYHNVSYSSDENLRRSRTTSSMYFRQSPLFDGSITPVSSRLTSIMAYNVTSPPSNNTSDNQLNQLNQQNNSNLSKSIVLTTIS